MLPLFVVEQDAVGGAFQIVVLAGAERPQKHRQTAAAKDQARAEQIQDDIHVDLPCRRKLFANTSSDELDGHFYFYPLYYEFCAKDDQERERVRDVIRGITDHIIDHDFLLIDIDGTPTRWGVYSPKLLNHDRFWWA